MNFYREAAIALRQNSRSVLPLVAIGMVFSGLDAAIRLFVLHPAANAPDRTLGLALVGWQIVSVAVVALPQTVFFARIGREMDKPMWRVPDDREAAARFYRLWLLLGLLSLFYVESMGTLLRDSTDFATGLTFLASFFTLATLAIVFGATVMFYGRAGRQEVGEALSTMGRHLAVIAAICLFGILAGLFLSTLEATAQSLGKAQGAVPWYVSAQAILLAMATGAMDSLVDCFIFAYTWLVCIFNRDHFEEPGDDFDF